MLCYYIDQLYCKFLKSFFDINKLVYNIFNYFRLFNKNRIKILDKGFKVRIINVIAEDNGIYLCRAENIVGVRYSFENFLLNVKGKLRGWNLQGVQQKYFVI